MILYYLALSFLVGVCCCHWGTRLYIRHLEKKFGVKDEFYEIMHLRYADIPLPPKEVEG